MRIATPVTEESTEPPGYTGLTAPTAWQRARRRFRDDKVVGWIASLTITAIAFLLRVWHLGTPHVFEFDETYYAKDAWSMLHYGYARNWDTDANQHILDGQTTGLYQLDSHGHPTAEMVVHPDLGKWLIAIGEHFWGLTPFGWRIVSAVFGSLMILLMIRFVRRVTGSMLLGALGGLLLCFDGLEFVLSRLALLDIFEAFFILAAVHTMVIDRDWYRRRLAKRLPGQVSGGWGPVWSMLWRPWLLLAGVLWGCALGVKWDALYPLAAFGLLYVAWCAGARRSFGVHRSGLKALVADGIPAFAHLVLVAAIVYVATWTGWLMHARQFEDTLSATQYTQFTGQGRCDGDTYVDVNPNLNAEWPSAKEPAKTGLASIPQNFSAFISYERDVYTFHTKFLDCTTHTYASHPSGWLLLNRPVGVAADTGIQPGTQGCTAAAGSDCLRQVLLLGTPALWWGCDLAAIAALVFWIGSRDWRFGVAIVGIASTWLPWLQYAGRPIFSYYSIATLPFLILAAVLCVGKMLRGRWHMAGVVVSGAFLVLVIANFAWFWPIYTDKLLTNAAWLNRIWFNHWI